MPEDESYFIKDVELKWLLFRDVTRLRLLISADKRVYREDRVKVGDADLDSRTVWSSEVLDLHGLEESTIVNFKLYSLGWLFFPRRLGCAQIPISEMLKTDQNHEDSLLLLGRSSLATVGLQISFSMDSEEIAGRLVKRASKPIDPLNKFGPVLDRAVAVKRMIDIVAESHPTAKLAWSFVSMGIDILKKQKDTNEQVAKLYEIMISTYEMASENKALRDIKRLTSVYEALFKQTISCAQFIEGYAKQGILGRTISVNLSDKVNALRGKFQDLHRELHLQISTETLEMTRKADEWRATEEIVRKLAAASELPNQFDFGPASTCMTGTRVQAIVAIEKWIKDCNGSTLWCHGMAGTGKSSLMGTLHDNLGHRRLGSKDKMGGDDQTGSRGSFLAAFIRYDRNSLSAAETLIPGVPIKDKLILTIAHSLCNRDPAIRNAICDAINLHPDVLSLPSSSAKKQFQWLLQEPLNSIRGLLENGPSLVIIIDGLDERRTCYETLGVLAEGFGLDLPFMRLIVSSRPHKDIEDVFRAAVHPPAQLELDPSSTDASADISLYINSRFSDIYKDDEPFRDLCGKLDAVKRLTIQTQGLFICAVTACKFIAEVPCKDRLQRLLDTSEVARDSLAYFYKTALDVIVSESPTNTDLKQYIHGVLADIVALRPMHVWTLDNMAPRQTDGPRPTYVLRMLRSVLQVSKGNIILPVHQSFFDFLQDKEACGGDWYVNVEQERPGVRKRYEAISQKTPSEIASTALGIRRVGIASKVVEIA